MNFSNSRWRNLGRGLLDAEFRLMDFSSDQGVVSAAQERDMALQKLSDAEANDRQTPGGDR